MMAFLLLAAPTGCSFAFVTSPPRTLEEIEQAAVARQRASADPTTEDAPGGLHAVEQTPPCTTSPNAPSADVFLATIFGVTAIVTGVGTLVANETLRQCEAASPDDWGDPCFGEGLEALGFRVGAVVSLTLAALFTASAIQGHSDTAECREHWADPPQGPQLTDEL
jgi:hypothetical protein